MKRHIFDVRIIKNIGICAWHCLSITIHVFHAATSFECIFPDTAYGIADGYARQAATSFERTNPDASHGVGDGDVRQAATIQERPIPDTGHGVGDGYAGQSDTLIVFVCCLVSVICALNGRKVTV